MHAMMSHWGESYSLIEYYWDFDSDGVFTDAQGDQVEFTPSISGEWIVAVEARVGTVSTFKEHLMTVEQINLAPEIIEASPDLPLSFLAVNETIYLMVNVSDTESDPITYRWFIDGLEVEDQNQNTFTFQMLDDQLHRVKVMVNDGYAYHIDQSFIFLITSNANSK